MAKHMKDNRYKMLVNYYVKFFPHMMPLKSKGKHCWPGEKKYKTKKNKKQKHNRLIHLNTKTSLDIKIYCECEHL